jgi:proliferating cell nuclear antigen PCNA
MKEDRIFEYKIEHDNINNFKNLFEVLGQVLHELRLTHIKPLKSEESDEQKESGEESSESEEDSEDSTESEDERPKGKNTKQVTKQTKQTKQTKKTSKKEISKKTSQWDNNNSKKEQGGIKILEVNDYKTIIVHVRLFAKNFYKFQCKYDTYTIGLEPQTMYNFIKNIDKEGVMSVYVTEGKKQIMNIELNNQENKNKSTYEFKLMDLNQTKHQIASPQFDVMVEMETDEFHNMCKEMHTHGKNVGIVCTEKKIRFYCKGNSGIITKEFENGGCVVISLKGDNKKTTEPIIISEVFDLQNITAFNKCRSLCTYIQLLLKNKYPMFIRYEVATLGVMQVGFVPTNDDNINKNMNYNENNDQFYTEPVIKMKTL